LDNTPVDHEIAQGSDWDCMVAAWSCQLKWMLDFEVLRQN
jgi:hypothetical protein